MLQMRKPRHTEVKHLAQGQHWVQAACCAVWAVSLCHEDYHKSPRSSCTFNRAHTWFTGRSFFPSCLRKHLDGKNYPCSVLCLKHEFERVTPCSKHLEVPYGPIWCKQNEAHPQARNSRAWHQQAPRGPLAAALGHPFLQQSCRTCSRSAQHSMDLSSSEKALHVCLLVEPPERLPRRVTQR